MAGASGLALDERAQTLYISDLGSRCIWSAAASARSLTAGGKGCQSSFSGLPGYPGALALDEDSTLYISYHWASSSWLERHAGSTFLRGVALRLSESMQESLFSLPADGIRAEAVSTASGSWLWSFSGKPQGSSSALCPVENRVYLALREKKRFILHGSEPLRHASHASSLTNGSPWHPGKIVVNAWAQSNTEHRVIAATDRYEVIDMTDAFKQQIQAEARQAVEELLEQAKLKKGDVFVVGCSSSEIVAGDHRQGQQSGGCTGRVCRHCTGAGSARHLAGGTVL